MSDILWKGVPLEDYSKTELIKILEQVVWMNHSREKERERQETFMRSLAR